jgi:GNAT superfamily N-acetyltransferase
VNAPGIEIRHARREDLPAIVRLLAEDQLGHHRELYADPLDPAYHDAFKRIAADANNELMVLEADGEVVGTLQLTFIPYLTYRGGMRAQIEAVRIDRRFRGRGLGTQLVRWSIERARQEGCALIQLTTNARREDAHRFYKRLGFTPSHIGMKLRLSTEHDIRVENESGQGD